MRWAQVRRHASVKMPATLGSWSVSASSCRHAVQEERHRSFRRTLVEVGHPLVPQDVEARDKGEVGVILFEVHMDSVLGSTCGAMGSFGTVGRQRWVARCGEPRSQGANKEGAMSETHKLNAHHRATVQKIFQHPVSHNIQWHDVASLLRAVGEVTEEHDGRLKVVLGPETETLDVPAHHDINEQMVVDLRRMLKGAGITA